MYAEWRYEKVDYLVASSEDYNQLLSVAREVSAGRNSNRLRIFEQSRAVVRFSPSRDTPGPELRIFKVIP